VTNFTPTDLTPPVTRNYVADPVQVGLFLDAAGQDTYLERDPATGAETKSSTRKDGAASLRPADPARETGGRHAGIFFDRSGRAAAPIGWFGKRWTPAPLP
jgi:hypothetical protein